MDNALVQLSTGGAFAVVVLHMVFRFLNGKLADVIEVQTDLLKEMNKEKSRGKE